MKTNTAQITKRLIAEKGFTAVAVEADWPDAYRVNRYARGASSDDEEAVDSLGDFKRFPAWMWRNADALDFVGWLRGYNDSLPAGATKAGFYGLDLYSLHSSVEAVLDYLDKVDPEAAERARYRYSCFEAFGEAPQAYGYAAGFGLTKSCEDAVLVGFTTYSGTVTAASNWGGPAERKRVRPALLESYEALFHEAQLERFLLALRDNQTAASLRTPRLERAIGVIYRPETERISHYFNAQLSGQFDAVLHFDQTRAVEPLERTSEWEEGEIPETFPSGI